MGGCRPVPVVPASISKRLLTTRIRRLQFKKQIIGNAPHLGRSGGARGIRSGRSFSRCEISCYCVSRWSAPLWADFHSVQL